MWEETSAREKESSVTPCEGHAGTAERPNETMFDRPAAEATEYDERSRSQSGRRESTGRLLRGVSVQIQGRSLNRMTSGSDDEDYDDCGVSRRERTSELRSDSRSKEATAVSRAATASL